MRARGDGGDVVVRLAADVKLVRILEDSGISVRGAVVEHEFNGMLEQRKESARNEIAGHAAAGVDERHEEEMKLRIAPPLPVDLVMDRLAR